MPNFSQNHKPDLDSALHIAQFVDSFYRKVLVDALLAPMFTDVAQIDIAVHIPHIRQYWEKLLLGDKSYQRHTMNIHRELHRKSSLTEEQFARWLALFEQTANDEFFGVKTDRAVAIARSIAGNMAQSLSVHE